MPVDWGWQLKGQSFIPIMTGKEAGTPDLLDTLYDEKVIDVIVVKPGWTVPHSVKNAMALHVLISSSIMTWMSEEDDDDDFEDRNFMDIFAN